MSHIARPRPTPHAPRHAAFMRDGERRERGALAHPRHVDLLIEPGDVLGDGALQQTVVLSHEGSLAAQGLRVPAGERLAVDVDAAVKCWYRPATSLMRVDFPKPEVREATNDVSSDGRDGSAEQSTEQVHQPCSSWVDRKAI